MSQGASSSASGPFLHMIIEPEAKKRFRYESEGGSHGVLLGKYKVDKKKTYPTVKLENYWGPYKNIFIRVSLCTEEKTEHVWAFQKKKAPGSQNYVDENLKESYTAEFKNLTILSKKKEEVYEALMNRKIELLGRNLSRNARERYENENMEAVKKEAKQISNSVILRFDAFERGKPDVQLCPSLYSEPICNQKASDKGGLKIHRMSKVFGSWKGGEEVILLCDKIQKENIKILFYETDVEDGWKSYATFNPADVHYQVAITFKTPSYVENVKKEVAVALERQDELSEPRPFTFIPDDYPSKKRKMDFSERLQSPMSTSCPGSSSTDDNSQENSTMLISNLSQESHFFSPDNASSNNFFSNGEKEEDIPLFGSFNEILGQNDDIWNDDIETPSEEDPMSTFDGEFWKHLLLPEVKMDMGKVEGQMDTRKFVGQMDTREFVGQMDTGKFEGQMSMGKLVGQMASMEIKDFKSVGGIPNICDKKQSRGVKSSENQKEKFKKYLSFLSQRDNCGNTLLHFGVINNKNIRKLIQVIKVTNSDILNIQNCNGQTALHIAVEKNLPIIQELLLNGSNPTIQNADGNNCYHIACLNDFDTCMRNLVTCSKFPGGVNEFNYEGLTPLHIAVKKHSPLCFDILTKTQGIDLGIKEKMCDKSLLHYAVEYQPSFVLPILRQTNIDVNIQDSEGNTPLHIACAKGDYDTVKHLLLAKANPLILNFKQNYPDSDEENSDVDIPSGQAPADLTNDHKILELLKQASEEDLSSLAVSADNSGSEENLLKELCNLLDSNNRWREVANFYLDEVYFENLNCSPSPTRDLLDFVKKQSNGEEYIENLKNVLEMLNFMDAVQVITESHQPLIEL